MTETQKASVRDLLLTRRGLASVPPDGGESRRDLVRGVELELADLGYVLKTRLSERLGRVFVPMIAEFRSWAISTLLAYIGGDQKRPPLFRRFPDGVPDDTEELWWKKVLVHYLQAEDRPLPVLRPFRNNSRPQSVPSRRL